MAFGNDVKARTGAAAYIGDKPVQFEDESADDGHDAVSIETNEFDQEEGRLVREVSEDLEYNDDVLPRVG